MSARITFYHIVYELAHASLELPQMKTSTRSIPRIFFFFFLSYRFRLQVLLLRFSLL